MPGGGAGRGEVARSAGDLGGARSTGGLAGDVGAVGADAGVDDRSDGGLGIRGNGPASVSTEVAAWVAAAPGVTRSGVVACDGAAGAAGSDAPAPVGARG